MIDKIVSRAPGRVCLFGDHQDYLSLPIIATTINRSIEVNATRNNSRYFKIFKKDLGELTSIKLSPISNEINKLLKDEKYLDSIISNGKDRAINVADPVLSKIYEIIGFFRD